MWKTRVLFPSVSAVNRLASTLQLGQNTRLVSLLSTPVQLLALDMAGEGREGLEKGERAAEKRERADATSQVLKREARELLAPTKPQPEWPLAPRCHQPDSNGPGVVFSQAQGQGR